MRISPLAPAVVIKPTIPAGIKEYANTEDVDGGEWFNILYPAGISSNQYVVVTSAAVRIWRLLAAGTSRHTTVRLFISDGTGGAGTIGMYSFRDVPEWSIITYSHIVNMLLFPGYEVGFEYQNNDIGGAVRVECRVSGLVYNR